MIVGQPDAKMNKLVPFGKYKGQPLEVLAQDRKYLDWLMEQGWFRERYQGIYTLIVNNFGEASETPEHNALQVLFLEDDFCLKFLRALTSNFDAKIMLSLDQQRLANLGTIQWAISNYRAVVNAIAVDRRWESEATYQVRGGTADGAWVNDKEIDFARSKILDLQTIEKIWQEPVRTIDFTITRDFEAGGVDVILRANMSSKLHPQDRQNEIDTNISYHNKKRSIEPIFAAEAHLIEIKPTVGDDYPAVLRQMRANHCEILFLEEYTGIGASQDQFIKTFREAKKRVVFHSECGK